MSTNLKYRDGRRLSLTATHPTTPASGSLCRVGPLVGVASTDERSDGKTSIDLTAGVYNIPVKAVDDDGNVAVAIGDPLFYVDADVNDGTGFLSKKASGYFAGHALQAVTSGSTSTVMVRFSAPAAPGRLDAGNALAGTLRVAVVAGGAAGNRTIAGIATADKLVSVLQVDIAADTGTSATGNKVQNVVDLTSEFTITAANTINNTSGTATTGDVLLVIWVDRT